MAFSRTKGLHGAPGRARVHPPPGRWSRGWRSRCLITAAYLAALGGLVAVAVTGTDAGAGSPINERGEAVVLAPDLVEVIERSLAPAGPRRP